MKLPDYTSLNRLYFRPAPKESVALNGTPVKEEAVTGAAAYGLGSLLGSLATISFLNRGKKQEAEIIVVEKIPEPVERRAIPNWAKLAAVGLVAGVATFVWLRRRRARPVETPASGWAPSENESGEGILSIRAVPNEPMPDVPADQPLVTVPTENPSGGADQNPPI